MVGRLLGLFLLLSSGCFGAFQVHERTVFVDNLDDARAAVVVALLRSGYTIDEASSSVVRTTWRTIQFYPNDEWRTINFQWRILVYLIEEPGDPHPKVSVRTQCLEQTTKRLKKVWYWKKCSEPDFVAYLEGTVHSVAAATYRNYHRAQTN